MHQLSSSQPVLLPSRTPQLRRSAPIEIPTRRNLSDSHISPFRYHTSSDLIFDMSPVPQDDLDDFSARAVYPPDLNDPFLYPFPVLPKRPVTPTTDLHSRLLSDFNSASPVQSFWPEEVIIQPPRGRQLTRTSDSCHASANASPNPSVALGDEAAPQGPTSEIALRLVATTKITGFAPPSRKLPRTSTPRTPRNRGCISPSPRRSSFSSSPWILPGGKKRHVDCSSPIDCGLDFAQFMLSRIERERKNGPSKRPSRHRSFVQHSHS